MTTFEKEIFLKLAGWNNMATVPGKYFIRGASWINREINDHYWTLDEAIELQKDPNSLYIWG